MRNMRGIFVEADAPEFLENEIEPEREVLDLNSLNVADMLAARRARQLTGGGACRIGCRRAAAPATSRRRGHGRR